MFTFHRAHPLFFVIAVTALLLRTPSLAADNKTNPPSATPPIPAPAFLDVVTFNVYTDNENHGTVVTTGPTLLRVDETDDGFSIIYDPQTDYYVGLEHRNYTYWDFSWPEVRAAVATTKRYAAHLRDLSIDGVSAYDPSAGTNTNDASSTSAPASPDNAGYVWKSTTDKKRMAGLDCVRWIGETISGESVEAWCFNGPLPKVQTAMEELRKINEPIALVPVRTLVPPIVFPVYDGLIKGGVTPVSIVWGEGRDKNYFSLVSVKTRDGNPSLFAIPKLYVKTTLITMDGITNPAPPVTPINQKKPDNP